MAGSRGTGQEAARPILEVMEVLQKMEITVAYVRVFSLPTLVW